MRVRWTGVSIFLAGFGLGVALSLLNFLTVVDISGYPREQSVGYRELANMEFLRRLNETRRQNKGLGLRVTCWVLTMEEHHATKGIAVKNTWGRRCDRLVFISTKEDATLGAVRVDGPHGRRFLWGKTKAGLRYIYEHHLNDSDWFIKADDDTYVIMENLRFMLSTRNSSELVYLGYRFKHLVKQGYMSGGAGYVLSSASLRLIVEKGLTNKSLCSASEHGSEDLFLGRCLQNLGIPPGDSRDEAGRDRFFPLPLSEFMSPDPGDWIWTYAYYRFASGLECCSDTAVAFHYVDPRQMYVYEYFLYYLRVQRLGPGPGLGRTQLAIVLNATQPHWVGVQPEVTWQLSDLDLKPSDVVFEAGRVAPSIVATRPPGIDIKLEEVRPSGVVFKLDEITLQPTKVGIHPSDVTSKVDAVTPQPYYFNLKLDEVTLQPSEATTHQSYTNFQLQRFNLQSTKVTKQGSY